MGKVLVLAECPLPQVLGMPLQVSTLGQESPSLCTCCLRQPYLVIPRGLNTAKIAMTSNTRSPPTEWSNVPGNARGSPIEAAVSARSLTTCPSCSKMVVAKMVSRSLIRTQ